MTLVHRVLFPDPITSLDEYLARGGGAGLEAAQGMTPEALIAELEASGLRGRGGAGFPTGRKWRTVSGFAAETSGATATVVVNGAEGEPGTFKDRTILRNDPYQVIEGALIAARAVGAAKVLIGLKRSFVAEVTRVRAALDEVRAAGWSPDVAIDVLEGPDEYLYGEETALLEVADGRHPFPRIAPPYRRGIDEVVEHADDVDAESSSASHVEMASDAAPSAAAPTLVDNVETLANVPRIIARGATWFRTTGTEASPGTIVCTVTGSTVRAGVGEVAMGTPMREVIELVGGGPRPGHEVVAVLSGVSNAILPARLLDTPVSYEALADLGYGLGSAGFIVLDDSDDVTAAAAGVSRFLAVESCGQCTPCKADGLALADLLARLSRGTVTTEDLEAIDARSRTVVDRARCYLATQQQVVVSGLFAEFPDDVRAHAAGTRAAEPRLVAELVDISNDQATLDERHATKQPDWTYEDEWSGQVPAERYDDARAETPPA